jgi:hypothetical protein
MALSSIDCIDSPVWAASNLSVSRVAKLIWTVALGMRRPPVFLSTKKYTILWLICQQEND